MWEPLFQPIATSDSSTIDAEHHWQPCSVLTRKTKEVLKDKIFVIFSLHTGALLQTEENSQEKHQIGLHITHEIMYKCITSIAMVQLTNV